jgi:hypothetical protein
MTTVLLLTGPARAIITDTLAEQTGWNVLSVTTACGRTPAAILRAVALRHARSKTSVILSTPGQAIIENDAWVHALSYDLVIEGAELAIVHAGPDPVELDPEHHVVAVTADRSRTAIEDDVTLFALELRSAA